MEIVDKSVNPYATSIYVKMYPFSRVVWIARLRVANAMPNPRVRYMVRARTRTHAAYGTRARVANTMPKNY